MHEGGERACVLSWIKQDVLALLVFFLNITLTEETGVD